MVTKTQLGQHAIYNSGLPPQGGGGPRIDKFIGGLRNANEFARDNKLITKTKGVTDVIGLTPYLDRKSNGLYSKGADYAMSKGYGKKKKKRTTKKK